MGKTGRLYSPEDSVRLVTKVLSGSLVQIAVLVRAVLQDFRDRWRSAILVGSALSPAGR
jgi:hypothetical protein